MDQIESLKSLNKILSSSLPYNLIMTLDQIDNLLTNALIATNHVQNCAMVIIKTGKVVGTSKGFKLRLQDIQTLQRAFKNANVIRDDGIYFQNEKYSCVRVDNHSVYARNGNPNTARIPHRALPCLKCISTVDLGTPGFPY
ncbi:profilin-4 isoform X2 [Callorhinchus milii]|uniref:profilin-4 isoform X2 n=1 Tax=Callorhinchus milii TaxID=7868 RepID=UPI000457415C|nr:profilin-4 isoform X2 [Callorhinchus milii]|eukprot:gi/632970153/ref/XP_007901488.1/ PREDICTED: profilin-4 isoform X2 [Callorhinchus milii]